MVVVYFTPSPYSSLLGSGIFRSLDLAENAVVHTTGTERAADKIIHDPKCCGPTAGMAMSPKSGILA